MIAKAKIIGLFLLGAQAIFNPRALASASVTLAWDPSPGQVAGYIIHTVRTNSQVITSDVGNTTTAAVNNLNSGEPYTFYVTAYNTNRAESDPSNSVNYTPPQVTPSQFLVSDTVTRGNWRGIYGEDGVWVQGAVPQLPAYASISTTNKTWTWASSSTDPDAPWLPDGSRRIAACWYDPSVLNFTVNIKDGQSHRLSMYFWDGSSSGRQERVDLVDLATGIILDRQMLSSFTNGVYLSWEVTGNVGVQVASYNVNAVVSAIFFDPLTPTAARFVRTDSTTLGNWPNAYGTEGSIIPMDSVQRNPSYATVSPTRYSQWAYSTDGSDPRALVQNDGSGRIASVWYSQYPTTNAFYVDVAIGDGATHQLAVYALDWWRQGRSMQVDVINAVTGQTLDSQKLASYSGGQYLVWNVKGKVRLKFSTLGGPNAMISGLFFDRSTVQL
jgi:hypothetical protein